VGGVWIFAGTTHLRNAFAQILNFLTNTTHHCMSEQCSELQLKFRGLKGSSQFQWCNQRGEGSKYFKCSGLVCN
jgi:hypothetical protein